MPIWLRRFTIKEINKAIKEEKERLNKQQKAVKKQTVEDRTNSNNFTSEYRKHKMR